MEGWIERHRKNSLKMRWWQWLGLGLIQVLWAWTLMFGPNASQRPMFVTVLGVAAATVTTMFFASYALWQVRVRSPRPTEERDM